MPVSPTPKIPRPKSSQSFSNNNRPSSSASSRGGSSSASTNNTKVRSSSFSHHQRPSLSSNSWTQSHSNNSNNNHNSSSNNLPNKQTAAKKEAIYVEEGKGRKVFENGNTCHGDIVGHTKIVDGPSTTASNAAKKGKTTFAHKRNMESPEPGFRVHLKRGPSDQYKSHLLANGAFTAEQQPVHTRRRCITPQTTSKVSRALCDPSSSNTSNNNSNNSNNGSNGTNGSNSSSSSSTNGGNGRYDDGGEGILALGSMRARPSSAPRVTQSTEGILHHEPEKYKVFAQREYDTMLGCGRKRAGSSNSNPLTQTSTQSNAPSVILPATPYIHSSVGSSMELPFRPRRIPTSNSSGVASSLSWS